MQMACGYKLRPSAVTQRTSVSSRDSLLDMHGAGSYWRRKRIAWLRSVLLSHAVFSLALRKYLKM